MASNHQENLKQESPGKESGFPIGAVIMFILFAVLLPMVMFLAAGTFAWTMAWVYLGVHITFTLLSRALAWRKNPSLLRERAHSLEAEDSSPWDRALVVVVGLFGPVVLFLVAGLDFRYRASPDLPAWAQILALVAVIFGFSWGTWAFVVNAYFSAVVRIQEDRGQTVIQDGPYHYMRHPGYAGALVTYVAIPFMLGTFWALVPAGLLILFMILRTAMEDRTLQEQLPGYAEYATGTRYRLIPGIW
jgi:protein-S-isoprenylcysteine O-methyltransferase Ste14